jgi:hypothetical protein
MTCTGLPPPDFALPILHLQALTVKVLNSQGNPALSCTLLHRHALSCTIVIGQA